VDRWARDRFCGLRPRGQPRADDARRHQHVGAARAQ
jgi:hypothetical protein